jgi:DNA-binding winged helix-turn-helix (wHTH) protein/TolB-like protein/Tfp pilus assembly protein PilF
MKGQKKNYFFEDFQIDVSRNLLLRLPQGETVAVTRKAFQVLLLLVENRGELVSKDDLMAKVWQDSFVEEANLTQTISVLRKTLGENPNEHRFIVTESGKGYRFVAQVRESGGDEAGSEEKQAAPVAAAATAAQGSNYRKIYLPVFAVVLAVCLIAAAYSFWNRNDPQISPPPLAKEVRSIAVLPFKNIGLVNTQPDSEDQLLGIGMADAVITKLSHVKSIVVRQTRSVMRYADATPDVVKVGREINVDSVLEGNIQKVEGRIRVSVRLFRVSDGALIWAENFDERDADIFVLQDSISEKVARSLSLELNPDENDRLKHRYTENIEAYQLYNKGRFFWNNRNGNDLRKSIELFEQALAKDENYALAYSGLADSYVVLQFFSHTQKNDFFPKAKEAAEKALSLDADLAEPHAALALYKQLYEWDWEGAESEFKLAIATNPNYATAHQWYGEFLSSMGRFDESIAEVEKAAELDPLSLSTNTARAVPYLASGKYAEAIEKLKPALELDENFSLALLYMGRAWAGLGNHKEALAQYQKSIKNNGGGSPYFTTALINSYARDGQKKEAEKQLDELLKLAKNTPVSNYVLARGFAPLGYKEEALEKLEKAFEERDGLLIILKTDRNFDDLRGEARFQEILKKMRL